MEEIDVVIIGGESDVIAVELTNSVVVEGFGAQGAPGATGATGPAGPQGDSGAGATTYVFNQIISSDTWTIAHHLGKYPSVVIVDSGNSVVQGELTYQDSDTLVVTFIGAFSGTAYLN